MAVLERQLAGLTAQGARSRRLRIRFPAADTPRDIAHGLGVVPDGYRVEWANAGIIVSPEVLWTRDLAWLQADAADAEAVVVFIVATEPTVDAY